MEIICKCPVCKGDIIEEEYSYNCKCGFKIYKEMWGVKIDKETVKKICNNEETEVFEFKNDDKSWKAQLKYNKDTERLMYIYKEKANRKVVCKCPKCDKNIVDTGKYYICEDYKESCDFCVPKTIRCAEITEEDLKKLINGETLEKDFTWKSGKTGKAGIKLNSAKTSVELVFNK